MKKAEFVLNRGYIFDPEHKGAPYSMNNGESWMNNGELCEVMFKAVNNFAAVKDACGAYDVTDDVPELGASVKSSRCTLVNRVLGYDYDSVKRHYFATVHSTLWIWVTIKEDILTAYYMDAEEFETFMDKFAGFDKDRKVIRFKRESLKQLQWLDERV
jgi:hypothetical protein